MDIIESELILYMSRLNDHGEHKKNTINNEYLTKSDEKFNSKKENSEITENNKPKHADDKLEKNEYTESRIRVRKDTFKMMTKTFEPRELVPFSQLRSLNQKELLHSLEENDKLGIVIKDQLKVAMIDMDKYQMMVDVLQEYERLLDLIEEREEYERIQHRLESTRVVEYKQGMSLLEMAGIHPRR